MSSALAAVLFGCFHDFSMGSFSVVTPSGPNDQIEVLKAGVQGKSCIQRSIFTPPWREFYLPSYAAAVADALESVPGADVLVDARLFYRERFWLLFGRACAVAEGDAGAFE